MARKYPKYKPNAAALPPLLDSDKERQRLKSINKEIAAEQILKQKEQKLTKIMY